MFFLKEVFMKSSMPALYSLTLKLLLVYVLILIPLSAYLPAWTSFENNLFENAQVVVLLGGSLMCLCFARGTAGSPTHGMWLPSAGAFLILAFRELSWGRVFMIKGYTDIGEPILIASRDMPFRTPIHAAVGIFAVLCLYFLIRYAPWKRIWKEIHFPLTQMLLIIIGIVLSTWGDHHSIFYTMRDQVIEEMAELLMYLALCHMAWYYYLKIEKKY